MRIATAKPYLYTDNTEKNGSFFVRSVLSVKSVYQKEKWQHIGGWHER